MGENNLIKECVKCKQSKTLNEFHKCKNGRMGLHNYCKQCSSEHKKQYCKENAAYIKAYKQRPEVKKRQQELTNARYKNDKDFREKMLERNRLRRRQPAARNQDNFRRKTDINYKLKKLLARRMLSAIKNIKVSLDIEVNKCARTVELLGCSLTEFKHYLESKFTVGMNWENHGYGDNCWHIDHIKPCSAFDLTQESQQKECFHYSNLQPLWQKDNLTKRAYYNGVDYKNRLKN